MQSTSYMSLSRISGAFTKLKFILISFHHLWIPPTFENGKCIKIRWIRQLREFLSCDSASITSNASETLIFIYNSWHLGCCWVCMISLFKYWTLDDERKDVDAIKVRKNFHLHLVGITWTSLCIRDVSEGNSSQFALHTILLYLLLLDERATFFFLLKAFTISLLYISISGIMDWMKRWIERV